MKSLLDACLNVSNSCNLPRNQLWYNLQLESVGASRCRAPQIQ